MNDPKLLSKKRSPKFIPGLKLSELYYRRVIAPILKRKFPALEYSCGLIGSGSEVLGYDTPQSRDHNWGLRLLIFLSEANLRNKRAQLDKELKKNLPQAYLDYSTSFEEPDERGIRLSAPIARRGEVNHYISFLTINSFFRGTLALDSSKALESISWLVLPQQKLLEVTSGSIFHDELGLKKVVEKFRYFPKDIWLYIMASQWEKISQEEAFVARASSVGDELGSKVLSYRIAKEIMELCFFMERRYVPYSKWFGKAFSELDSAKRLWVVLTRILESDTIFEREKWLSRAYQIVADKHNSLNITESLPTKVSKYHDRPYLVIHASKFALAIRKQIKDKRIRSLPLIGSIDQLTDNSSLLENHGKRRQLKILY